MPDNVDVTPGTGATVRTVQKGGASGPEAPVGIIDQGGAGAESLVSLTNPLYVQLRDSSGNVIATLPVSAAALPLPTGASIAAKQPALGVAGTPSTDVISVQGVASGTPQPVSDDGGSLTVDNGGTFAVQDSQKVADNAGFTDGSTPVQPVGFIFDEAAGTALTENDAAAARVDSKRAQVLVIEDETTRGRRATVTAGNALKVDGSAATQPVSGTVTANAGTGTLAVSLASLPALATGTNTVGNVGLAPRTSGGLTISRTLSAASTNATSVKASAGQLYGWYLYNANAAVRYLKFYNKASAPTVGSDTPVMTIPIPAGAAANVEFSQGIAFGTGLAFALTTGVADSDTAAVAANEIILNLLYV